MTPEEARRRMNEGRIYPPDDEALMREQLACLDKLFDFNATQRTGKTAGAAAKDVCRDR